MSPFRRFAGWCGRRGGQRARSGSITAGTTDISGRGLRNQPLAPSHTPPKAAQTKPPKNSDVLLCPPPSNATRSGSSKVPMRDSQSKHNYIPSSSRLCPLVAFCLNTFPTPEIPQERLRDTIQIRSRPGLLAKQVNSDDDDNNNNNTSVLLPRERT